MNFSRCSGRCALFYAVVSVFFLSSCGKTPAPGYQAAIQEGQTAAQELIRQGNASSLAIALADGSRIIWSQTFGLADREAGVAPAKTTVFGIGSVSKMFAAVAAMKLVDQGVVKLDDPLVKYVPGFKMDSAGYREITIRMLLNHSSGLPGSDYRNLETTVPYLGYLEQLMQTLSAETLKTAPGYMSVYCNDGFSLIEMLVSAVAGKDFIQYVDDEILAPLGMKNTIMPVTAVAEGSYSKCYDAGEAEPFDYLGAFAAGGIYSTADDMARFMMMFLGNGATGGTRIISEASVAEMAKDQTVAMFNPVHSDAWAYGLGWDTVMQPGLKAVGFGGWAKGGDSAEYHAEMIVSPEAQLGVVVMGTSGFNSGLATLTAERILLRALAENGRIAAFPIPLPAVVPPVVPVPDGLLESIAGDYAMYNQVYRIRPQTDGTLLVSVTVNGESWVQGGAPFKYRGDGFSTDAAPLKTMKFIEAGGARYMLAREPGGYGHYLDNLIKAQKVFGTGSLSAAWSGRLSKTWLIVNELPDTLEWRTRDPRLRLATIPELGGLIGVRPSYEVGYYIVNPSESDEVARMMLVIPQMNGRDLDDLNIVHRSGQEWARFGSFMYAPLEAVKTLSPGSAETVTIGEEGYAEWRAVAAQSTAVSVKLVTTGSWRVYDSAFTAVDGGKGDAETVLPAGSGPGYIMLFGEPGQSISVTVQ